MHLVLTIQIVSVMLAGWQEIELKDLGKRKWAFYHAQKEFITARLFRDKRGEIITIGNVSKGNIADMKPIENDKVELIYFIFDEGSLKAALPARKGTRVVSFCISAD